MKNTLFDFRLIQAKYNTNMVMTVSMPTMSTKDEYGMPITYTGCQVTLQHRKTAQFGRASQKWSYDTASGFIFAFSASGMDKGNFDRLFPCEEIFITVFRIYKSNNVIQGIEQPLK